MPRQLSPEEESLTLGVVRQVADDVARIIAAVDSSEIDGNIHLPKPSLVSALSRYFGEAGADRDAFIRGCYER